MESEHLVTGSFIKSQRRREGVRAEGKGWGLNGQYGKGRSKKILSIFDKILLSKEFLMISKYAFVARLMRLRMRYY